jgi:hypothetical protein
MSESEIAELTTRTVDCLAAAAELYGIVANALPHCARYNVHSADSKCV